MGAPTIKRVENELSISDFLPSFERNKEREKKTRGELPKGEVGECGEKDV